MAFLEIAGWVALGFFAGTITGIFTFSIFTVCKEADRQIKEFNDKREGAKENVQE